MLNDQQSSRSLQKSRGIDPYAVEAEILQYSKQVQEISQLQDRAYSYLQTHYPEEKLEVMLKQSQRDPFYDSAKRSDADIRSLRTQIAECNKRIDETNQAQQNIFNYMNRLWPEDAISQLKRSGNIKMNQIQKLEEELKNEEMHIQIEKQSFQKISEENVQDVEENKDFDNNKQTHEESVAYQGSSPQKETFDQKNDNSRYQSNGINIQNKADKADIIGNSGTNNVITQHSEKTINSDFQSSKQKIQAQEQQQADKQHSNVQKSDNSHQQIIKQENNQSNKAQENINTQNLSLIVKHSDKDSSQHQDQQMYETHDNHQNDSLVQSAHFSLRGSQRLTEENPQLMPPELIAAELLTTEVQINYEKILSQHNSSIGPSGKYSALNFDEAINSCHECQQMLCDIYSDIDEMNLPLYGSKHYQAQQQEQASDQSVLIQNQLENNDIQYSKSPNQDTNKTQSFNGSIMQDYEIGNSIIINNMLRTSNRLFMKNESLENPSDLLNSRSCNFENLTNVVQKSYLERSHQGQASSLIIGNKDNESDYQETGSNSSNTKLSKSAQEDKETQTGQPDCSLITVSQSNQTVDQPKQSQNEQL